MIYIILAVFFAYLGVGGFILSFAKDRATSLYYLQRFTFSFINSVVFAFLIKVYTNCDTRIFITVICNLCILIWFAFGYFNEKPVVELIKSYYETRKEIKQ